MRGTRAAAVVCLFGAACLAAPPDPPEPVSLEAGFGGGHGGRPAAVSIAQDGAAVVTLRGFGTVRGLERFELSLRLTAEEMDDLRGRIAESHFFEEWGAPDPGTRMWPGWDVTVFLGAREKRRTGADNQPEFAPLARHLGRFVAQAEATERVRRGESVAVAGRFEHDPERARLFRPSALAAELVPALTRAAVDAKDAYAAHEAARHLARLAEPADGAARLAGILAHVDGERRDSVLSGWLSEMRHAGRAAHRRAFAPIALAEARRPWEGWAQATERHMNSMRAVLGFAIRQRVPGAVEAADEKIRALSTMDRAFVPYELASLGAESVPFALRLLDDAEPATRLAGAFLLQATAAAAQPLAPSIPPFDPFARAATWARLASEAVPALERHAKDAAEPLRVRQECFDALTRCAGRDPEAERRAAYRAEQARKRAESKQREEQRKAEEASRAEARAAEEAKYRQEPAPKGELSIAGRVVGPGASPLAGFTVAASRDDGPPANRRRVYGWATTAADGTFRIDGLVAGAFTLVATGPDWSWRTMPKNSTLTDDVEAGETGVELRFVGAMLRGRIVGADGRPLARRDVAARMRDAPGIQDGTLQSLAWMKTDSDGRFLFLQLYDGVYDVEVPGASRLSGASEIGTGPSERVIGVAAGATIVGRVVDATGAPIEDANVTAAARGRPPAAWSRTGADGKFCLVDLDPAGRWSLTACFAEPRSGAAPRVSACTDAASGAADVVLTIDTGPSVAVRVEFAGRRAESKGAVRLVRAGEGAAVQRDFDRDSVLWRAAPEGTWHVFAHVRDLDERGAPCATWIELGTVTTGDPLRTLTVPR
jgi:hypothetical protein